MIKSFIFIICTLISFSAFTQNMHRYRTITDPFNFIYFPVEGKKKMVYVDSLGISKVKVSTSNISKHGKEKFSDYSTVYHFDNQGLISHTQRYEKGVKTYRAIYTYNNKRVTSVVTTNKKGDIYSLEYLIKDTGSRFSDYLMINKKGDTTFRAMLSKTNDLISTDYYYKKSKLIFYWINEYYENKRLKRSTMYKGNGKEKYVWDYQCKEDGIEIKKHKDTTTRCEIIETDKYGITTIIYHTVNDKGEVFKTINKRNKAGKYFYYKRTKGYDDIVLYEQTRTYAADDSTSIRLEYARYKKGNLWYKTIYTYDLQGNEVSRNNKEYKKGIVVFHTETVYEYDALNRPVKRLSSNSIKGSQHITHFEYEI